MIELAEAGSPRDVVHWFKPSHLNQAKCTTTIISISINQDRTPFLKVHHLEDPQKIKMAVHF